MTMTSNYDIEQFLNELQSGMTDEEIEKSIIDGLMVSDDECEHSLLEMLDDGFITEGEYLESKGVGATFKIYDRNYDLVSVPSLVMCARCKRNIGVCDHMGGYSELGTSSLTLTCNTCGKVNKIGFVSQ